MLEIRTFTPSSLSEVLAKCEITAAEKQSVRVHGILQDVQTSTAIRNNESFRRGKLCDTETKQLLNITFNPNENLKNFEECVLEGELDGWIPPNSKSEIKITPYFRVVKVVSQGKYKISENEIKIVQRKTELVDLSSRKIHKNITSMLVDLIENYQQPRIAVIYGKHSYTWEDIEKSLKGRERSYKFIPCEVNLSDSEQIINNLQKLDKGKFNLICLYRGGGDNLDIFNNLDIAECLVNLKTSFATAIGHAQDHPFIQAMADRVFETPTAIGAYLQKCSRDAFTVSRRLKESEEKENELYQAVERLNEQNAALQVSINRLSMGRDTLQIINKQDAIELHGKIANSLNKFLTVFERNTDEFQSSLSSNLKQSKNLRKGSDFQILLLMFLGIATGIFASFAYIHFYGSPISNKNPNIISNNSNTAVVNSLEDNGSAFDQNINVNSKTDRNNRRQKK